MPAIGQLHVVIAFEADQSVVTGVFVGLCTQVQGHGVMSTGTRPPVIRCIRRDAWTNTCHVKQTSEPQPTQASGPWLLFHLLHWVEDGELIALIQHLILSGDLRPSVLL